MARGLKRTLRGLVWALLAIVAVTVVLVVALQTGRGKDFLARTISRLATKPGDVEVAVRGIRGSVPFDFTIEEIVVSDAGGAWLRVRDLAADARPGALLGGRVAFESVSARSVDVARLPIEGEDEDDEPFQPPQALRVVVVDDLRVDELRVGRELVTPGARHVGAKPASGSHAAATVRNGAGTTAKTAAQTDDNGAGAELDLVEWSVPIAVRGGGAYALHPRNVDAYLKARAQSAVGLLPPDVEIAAGALTLTAGVQGYWLRPRGRIVLTADAPAAYGAAAEALTVVLRGAPTPLEDDERADAGAQAARDDPADAAAEPFRLDEALSRPGRDDDAPYHWVLRADLRSPRVSEVVDEALGRELHLSARGRVEPLKGRIELEDAAVAGASLRASTADVAVGLETDRIVVPRLTVELADFGALGGRVREVTTGGRATAVASGEIDLATRSARGTLTAQAVETDFYDDGLERFVGPDLTLRADYDFEGDDRALRVRDVVVEAAQASARGALEIAGEPSVVTAEIDARIASLADLSGVAGTALEGSVDVTASAHGPLDDLALEAFARPFDVRVGDAPKFSGTVSLRATDAAEAPAGRLEASVASRFGAVGASTDFALVPDETLELGDIRVRAEGVNVTGAATVSLADDTVQGALSGEFTDLRVLSPFVGGRLYGRGTMRVALDPGRGQSAKLNGVVEEFAYTGGAGVKSDRIRVDADLSDLRARPSGTAVLRAKDVVVADVTLAAVTVEASGDAGTWKVQAATEGHYLEPFSIRARANVAAAGGSSGADGADGGGASIVARVSELDGEVAGRRLGLRRDLVLASLEGGGFAAEQIDVTLGDARVTGAWRSTRDEVAGDLEIADLPLDLLRLYEPAVQLDGALDARVTATGTPESTELQFVAAAQDVEVAAVRGGEMPPITLRAEGRWGPQGLAADATLTGGAATRFVVRAQTPREGGSISLDLDGTADLAILNGLGVLGEDRVGGVLRTDLQMTGTTQAPRITGEIALSGGSYENAAVGASLDDVQALVRGEGARLRIERLEATDGGDGTLAASGVVDLSEGVTDASYDVSARLRSAEIARLDDLFVEAGGDLRVVGAGASPMISGRIETDRAEIRMPEQLPPEVVVFEDVIETNLGATRPDRYTAAEPPETLPVGFDLRVDMPGRIFVRGSELDTEWRGDLSVGGTSRAPILEGRLELVRGSFRILNVRLEAVKGTIIFDGGDEIDPLVEIVGETEKNDVVARVTISGRALAPEIAFTSEPPLPQDEILARLLFGKTPAELSAVESVQLAAAVTRLARGGGAGGGLDPVGWLRNTLNVDTLDVTSAEGTDGGSVLSVGKYVTEDVFVSLNQGITDNTSSASVEVELTDNLTLESEVGRDAEGSLGLNWKWDY